MHSWAPPARGVAKCLRLLGLQGRAYSVGWWRVEAGMSHECLKGVRLQPLTVMKEGNEV